FIASASAARIYTLPLHDALPIFPVGDRQLRGTRSHGGDPETSRADDHSLHPHERGGGPAVRSVSHVRLPVLRFRCRSGRRVPVGDRKSTRLNSSHGSTSYAVFCL